MRRQPWGRGRGVAALVMLAACARVEPNGEVVAQGPESSAAPSGTSVTLERFACFGTCPVYRLTLRGDGTVVFEGEQHVQQMGRATASIEPAAVTGLVAEMDRAGFSSFADAYTDASATCGRYVTDLPSAILTLTRDGRTKRVVHDYGCRSAPEALGALERRVDEVAGSARWVGAR